MGRLDLAVVIFTILLFPACNLAVSLPVFGMSAIYAAIGAVAEECFFRGFLFTALQKRGKYKAAILSSLAFALLHLVNLANYPVDYTILQVAAAFCVGFSLCGLLFKTKKLWPCLLCHLLINLTAYSELSPLSVGLICICMLLYAIFGVLLLKNDEVLV